MEQQGGVIAGRILESVRVEGGSVGVGGQISQVMPRQPLCCTEKQRKKGLERGSSWGICGEGWQSGRGTRFPKGRNVALKHAYKAGPLVVTDCDFEKGKAAKLQRSG